MKRRKKIVQAPLPTELDLNNTQHLEAIRFACWWLAADPKPVESKGLLESLACQTIVEPKSAASLVEKLIERAGVGVRGNDPTDDYYDVWAIDGGIVVQREDADGLTKDWTFTAAAALVTSLLNLAPSAGPDAVVKALEGAL